MLHVNYHQFLHISHVFWGLWGVSHCRDISFEYPNVLAEKCEYRIMSFDYAHFHLCLVVLSSLCYNVSHVLVEIFYYTLLNLRKCLLTTGCH